MLVSLNSTRNVAASKLGYSSYSKSGKSWQGLLTLAVAPTKLNFLFMLVQQLLSHQLLSDIRYNHFLHFLHFLVLYKN